MDTNWSSAKKVISPCPWRSNEETRKTKLHKRRGLVGAPIRTGPNANHQTILGAPKKLPLPPLISTMSHELLNYAHALEDVVDHKTKWSHSNLVLQVQALWPKRSNDCPRIVTVMFMFHITVVAIVVTFARLVAFKLILVQKQILTQTLIHTAIQMIHINLLNYKKVLGTSTVLNRKWQFAVLTFSNFQGSESESDLINHQNHLSLAASFL